MPVQPIILSNNSKYINDGLNILSNHPDVHKRDDAGNIVFKEKQNENPVLVVEPVRFNYTVKSTLDVLPTRFTYYEFPVTTLQSSAPLGNLDFNLNADEDIATEVPDSVLSSIEGYYKIPPGINENGNPTPLVKLNTSYMSSWYYGDNNIAISHPVANSWLVSGISENILRFNVDNSTIPNSYVITEDTIDYLTSRNKTLKFTLKLKWVSRYELAPFTGNSWPVGFVSKLVKQSTINGSKYSSQELVTYNLSINTETSRGCRWYKPDVAPDHWQQLITKFGEKDSYGVSEFFEHELWRMNSWPIMYTELTLDPTTLKVNDTFTLEGFAGGECYINAADSYWQVNVVDLVPPTSVPNVPISNKNPQYGINVMAEKTSFNTLASGRWYDAALEFNTPNTIPFVKIYEK